MELYSMENQLIDLGAPFNFQCIGAGKQKNVRHEKAGQCQQS